MILEATLLGLVLSSTVDGSMQGDGGFKPAASQLTEKVSVKCLGEKCLTPESARREVRRRAPSLRECFERSVQHDGIVAYELVVGPDGAVKQTSPGPTSLAANTMDCLTPVLHRLTFEKSASPARVSLELAFTRLPDAGTPPGEVKRALGGLAGLNNGTGGDGMPVYRPRDDLHVAPKFSVKCADSDGGRCLPVAVLARQLNANRNQIRYCWERVLLVEEGRRRDAVMVRFVISPDGRTTDVTAEAPDGGNPQLATCITGRIKTWMFPSVPVATAASVRWDFERRE